MERALAMLEPGGWMLCSTNCRRLEPGDLDGPLKLRINGASLQIRCGSSPPVLKDGESKKLKEEREGVQGWHEHFPGLAPQILAFRKRGASASRTLIPSGTTSLPMPSPGITAIR